MRAKALLVSKYPEEIVINLLSSYREVENNFRLGRWKVSELDAGHFVETVRRLLEHELFGSYTPFSQSLCRFSQNEITKYENATGHESLRLMIPRVLYGVYCIRNKRGVGHVSDISPNEMDAVYILYATKWIVAELVRQASSISPQDAEQIVRKTVERQVEAVWDDGESFMILDKSISTEDKLLITLYQRDNITDKELQQLVEYSHSTRFKAILKKLKQNRLIDYLTDKRCKISPLGVAHVEKILSNPKEFK